jgi:hypothetical protein
MLINMSLIYMSTSIYYPLICNQIYDIDGGYKHVLQVYNGLYNVECSCQSL